jgi:hypothetical protein
MAAIKINNLDNTSDDQSVDSGNLMTDLNETETNGISGGFAIPQYGAGFEL